MARTARSTPAELAPAPWPDRHSTDPSAEVARQFVLNLHDAMGGRTLRDVAAQVGIHHVTLLKILHGRAWPDLATVSRLEIGLNADLYSSADVRADLARAASPSVRKSRPRAPSE
ncbi:helix-turn-helix transcriptional regulator [Curtobacterium sp. MCPF17_011]|uniref:helix-turn-helix domain-containing protein n=1 Tax=Curtobacterium sp. MCPF17_011 TaxID=2175652 RepID=UPI0015E88666|nr:helix-turn-helix transcriptional regulator [Curtobacterium sp. MCPF17_011]